MEKKKCRDIQALEENAFLNFYHMDACSESGKPFDYYFVSRRKKEKLRLKTKDNQPEGVMIYPIYGKKWEKIVLIKQYRYPLDTYFYEFPAGMIEKNESIESAAKREFKEETGLELSIYEGGDTAYRRPFFMAPGFTDESNACIFGYAEGEISKSYKEDTENIEIVIADKEEVRRILREENVTLRGMLLMLQFLHTKEEEPFAFLQ